MYSNYGYRGRGWKPAASADKPSNSSRSRGRGRRLWNSHISNSPSQAQRIVEKPSCMNILIGVEFDENIDVWFKNLQRIYGIWKQPRNMFEMVDNLLRNVQNPYLTILNIIHNYSDNKVPKMKNMIATIVEEFKKWLTHQQNLDELMQIYLTPDVQYTAFNVIYANKNFFFIKMVAKIYQFETIAPQLLECVKYLIFRNNFKEACQMAIILNFYDQFTVEDFIIPLILQDKLLVVEEYLKNNKKLQIETIKFLDDILGKKCTVHNALDSFISLKNISDVKFEKLQPKTISKLLSRLLKLYKLPDNMAPNMNQKRVQGLINFLVHKKYVDHSLGNESWTEMIREAVTDDVSLQKELIYAVSVHDVQEALKLALYYNVDRSAWPYSVREFENNSSQFSSCSNTSNDVPSSKKDEEQDSWSVPNKETLPYHAFSLALSSVILINDEQSFQDLLDNRLMGVTVVGIDCEWKPNFGLKATALSLVQIATKDFVFILDVIELGNQVPHLWRRLATEFFNNVNLLKLGFGLSTDICMIKQNLPHLSNIYLQGVGYIDLLSLWKELLKTKKFKFPFSSEDITGNSLSALVEITLGTRLSKYEQFSNWENRPLRSTQLIYAATDAYCLLEIYDALQDQCFEQNINFDELCNKIMQDSKTNKKVKKTMRKAEKDNKMLQEDVTLLNDLSNDAQMRNVNSVKFVCDTMVQGLGKSLRRCGIDTIILDSFKHHDECVKIANKENRFILTRGHIFKKLREYVPMGHCYRVVADNLDDQLKEVLNFYHIQVRKEDIFSRCLLCNTSDFQKFTQKELLEEVERREQIKNTPEPYYNSLDAADYDDFQWQNEATGFTSDEDSYDEGTSVPIKTREYQRKGGAILNEVPCIQIDIVPEAVLQTVDLFYVCKSCGKVYWDGSHLDRLVNAGKLKDILNEDLS